MNRAASESLARLEEHMNQMHSQKHPARVLAFAVAILLVILPACGGSSTPLTAVITAPDATTALLVGQPVNITGKAAGNGLKSVDVYVDGAKYATVDSAGENGEFAVAAPWTPAKAGAHVIQLKGLNDKGEVVIASELVFVNVQGLPATATQPLPQPTQPPATVAPTAALATSAPVSTTTAAPAGPTVSVKDGDFVNVRKGPAVGYDKVGQIDKGQSAPVRGKSADGTWWQITFPAGPDGVGWVIGSLVTVNGDTANVQVAQAPALPTGAAVEATQPPPPAAATATSNIPPSALLPYSQAMRFSPRDDLGDVPLGYNGPKSSTLVWEVNGAKSLELEITTVAGTGIFQNCPTGNLSTISPNDAVGKRKPLPVPSGSYQFSIDAKGYYLFTIYVVKADGSTTTIPRNVIVDCYKTQ
jgi:uncharacterized protein YraI